MFSVIRMKVISNFRLGWNFSTAFRLFREHRPFRVNLEVKIITNIETHHLRLRVSKLIVSRVMKASSSYKQSRIRALGGPMPEGPGGPFPPQVGLLGQIRSNNVRLDWVGSSQARSRRSRSGRIRDLLAVVRSADEVIVRI